MIIFCALITNKLENLTIIYYTVLIVNLLLLLLFAMGLVICVDCLDLLINKGFWRLWITCVAFKPDLQCSSGPPDLQ